MSSATHTRGERALLVAASACVAAVVGLYLALGGATYKPLDVADPCDPRPEQAGETRSLGEELALSALDGAACSLRVPREELALALATPEGRAEFGEAYNLSDDAIEAAVESGLERSIDDAVADGRLSALEATLLREATQVLPVGAVIDALQSSVGQDAIEIAEDLLQD